MSSARSPLSGQEIALAANATRALLDSLLAETETTFHRWVILNFAGSGGGSVARDAVVARMQSALKVDVMRYWCAARGSEVPGPTSVPGSLADCGAGRM
jgi:hypothetical protein